MSQCAHSAKIQECIASYSLPPTDIVLVYSEERAANHRDSMHRKSEFNEDASTVNFNTVIAILESAQEAWNAGSVEGVLDKYVDDILYITNTGGPDGESLAIRGKENLRRRFQGAMDVVDSKSRFESIRFENGLVRTRLSVDMRHRETSVAFTITLRQILRFDGFRIAEERDFHDAARLAAFWKLVGDPLERLAKPISA